MDSSWVLVASVIAVALILVQLALITLRNSVRDRLFPAATGASRPAAVGASTRFDAAPPQSIRHSGNPSTEE
jgi:hypothetical protein